MPSRFRLTAACVAAAVAGIAAAAAPVLNGPLPARQVFPATNWWNLDVSAAPVDPRSGAFIDFVSGRTDSNATNTRRMHPDFGPPPYGIPYVVVSGDQPHVPVTFVEPLAPG